MQQNWQNLKLRWVLHENNQRTNRPHCGFGASMTVIIDGTAGITFPVTAGSASAVQASSGRVLQVVNAFTTTSVTSSSSTYADVGLSATITPSSSSSKVFIFINLNGCGKITTATTLSIKLQKNNSDLIILSANSIGYTGTTTNILVGSVSGTYYDSPATTSATTYKIQFANSAASGTVYVSGNSDYSQITLMEIAA